ncbi:MAG: AfsR/SARP family transcriptional regulator, partial [Bacteroidota bacterium]
AQMLGTFSLTIGDTSPKLPASRALSVFKYLLLHHKQKIPRDVLMDTFWPDAGLEAARNNLNVAMHNLRQALRSFTRLPVISFEDGVYYLEPSVEIWLDVEEFDRCVKEGRQLEAKNELAAAIAEYEISINLYRGDLLADNPYEEWTVLERERLRVAYLDILDHLSQIIFIQERYSACVTLCQLILSRDLCREDAHCRLMRCYSRLGQYSLALRQYQVCVEALQTELQVNPTPETAWLYEKIHQHEKV